MSNLVEELKWRGMIHDMMPGTEEQLNKEVTTAYVGIDPTADSLHIGHLVSIMLLKHLQMAGHKPLAVVGGATGMIGDPSFKAAERKLLTPEEIQHNVSCIKKQLERFLDFDNPVNGAEILNNYDWMKDYLFLDFIRDVGKHITVNYMMTKDSVKKRMETGISFTEFSYQLLQGYDFLTLYRTKGCKLQMGGSDQWGNITTGTELIRRMEGGEAFALTCPLITKADGTKFGKTEGGNVWLDPEKTSPYDFYQYWRNVDDADVMKCIRLLTFLPMEQIEEMSSWEGSQLNKAKEILAFELTSLVHGEEEAKKAQDAARSLFGGGGVSADIPSTILDKVLFNEDNKVDLISVLVKTGLVPSRSEVRRAIEQGGVSIDGNKITDVFYAIAKDAIPEDGLLVKRGKKKFHKIFK